MKRKTFIMALVVAVVMMLSIRFLLADTIPQPPSNFDEPDAGLSVDNPYLISTFANLRWLSETESAWGSRTQIYYYKQTADIDAIETIIWSDGKGFSPIGYGWSPVFVPFRSHYDGNNHTISNLFIYRPDQRSVALFGRLDGGSITNVRLENVDITGYDYVGGLGGTFLYTSTNIATPITLVENNSVTGVITGNNCIGGLAGSVGVSLTHVKYNSVDVTVSGYDSVGGLIGNITQATTYNNSSYGEVYGIQNVGGLVGISWGSLNFENTPKNEFVIKNSFSRARVTGESSIGGLVGYALSSTIINSYATGEVVGFSRVGGLVGTLMPMVEFVDAECYLINSVYDIQSTGVTYIVGYIHPIQVTITNSTGKTTEEMKMESTFAVLDWDFEDIWSIDQSINDGYPFLIYDSEVNESEKTLPVKQNILYANYPNPFNPETTISFFLMRDSYVNVDIYNIRGQKIKSLVSEFKTAGSHHVVWNGTDENGLPVSSGIYFHKMQSNDFTATKRMLLLK